MTRRGAVITGATTVVSLAAVIALQATSLPDAAETSADPRAARPALASPSPRDTDARFVPAYPGQPPPGTVLWGASITGNGDPSTRHEQPAGVPLSLRRTFWRWDQHDRMVATAREDLSSGRLPWVSTKTPGWSQLATGAHDGALDDLLVSLDDLDGPVWLTIHHEPEGGGGVDASDDPAGAPGHVAMNRHVRERMTALGTDTIALAPVLMAWSFDPRSGRDPDDWWAGGIYDFVAVDQYREREDVLLTENFDRVRRWAAARDMDVAVGEWGMRGADVAAGRRVRDWYDAAVASDTDSHSTRVIGLSAFDSGLNSPGGSWELHGHQLTVFHDLLDDATTAHIRDW